MKLWLYRQALTHTQYCSRKRSECHIDLTFESLYMYMYCSTFQSATWDKFVYPSQSVISLHRCMALSHSSGQPSGRMSNILRRRFPTPNSPPHLPSPHRPRLGGPVRSLCHRGDQGYKLLRPDQNKARVDDVSLITQDL